MNTTPTFKKDSKVLIFNEQENPVQAMIDYDFICKKTNTSVAAIVNPGQKGFSHYMWGQKDILIKVFPTIEDAIKENEINVMINFASARSAFAATLFALEKTDIEIVTVIAEGMTENESRIIKAAADKLNKMIIGPATVGGMVPGIIKIGNAGGTIQNVLREKLYVKGSVGLISKSGGMLNEMMSMITKTTDGIKEAIAIGGDRFPASSLAYHVKRMLEDPEVKLIVLLGEIGGTQENEAAKVIKESETKKTIIAHIIGSESKLLDKQIQFGHAGAKANKEEETPEYKIKTLEDAGVTVVKKFAEIKEALAKQGLKKIEKEEIDFPLDFNNALQLGQVRYKKNIITSIHHDVESTKSIGKIIGELWLKKEIDNKSAEFFEVIIKLLADHGAAVSGAQNTIVTARAGRDLVSSVVSGLLTIGPRFGGAINGSAQYFKEANDKGFSPQEFVDLMKTRNILIPGIGHKVKSKSNPDPRVTALKKYSHDNFTSHKYLEYALKVEDITTRKKESLILNIDGAIANIMLDLFVDLGFNNEEIDNYIEYETFNGFFVFARTLGLVGHFIDQKRLNQPLYRHPEWDIWDIN